MDDENKFEKEISEIKTKIKTFENMSWVFIWVGVLVFICGIFYWFVDKNDFNEVGDFVGGVAGSLWALAGLFFIYIAFLGQKIDIKYQQEDLTLTRAELKETKEVFKQQTQIMSNQQLDNTFFNLLDNHRKVVDSLKTGQRNYMHRGYGFNSHNSNLEIVSGYDEIRKVHSHVFRYLQDYSNYLKSNKIYNSDITSDNPLKIINQYDLIKILFNDISKIINFVEERINKKDIKFYREVLNSNLTSEEKFLFEAYNVNFNKNNIKYQLGIYESFDFEVFIKDSYIQNRFINIRGYNEKDNLRVSFDDKDNYSEMSIFYIDNKILKLVKTYKELNNEISLSEILLKIKQDSLITERNLNVLFEILISTKDSYNDVEIFYQYKFEYIPQNISFKESFRSEGSSRMKDWVKDYLYVHF